METNPTDPSQFRAVSGLVDGKAVEAAWTTALPKNVGKSNATTGEQQAIAEVLALYDKKRARKYYDDRETAAGKKFFAVMLAEKYKKLPEGVVYSQPKLDGFRLIATREQFISRDGKVVVLPHIRRVLEPLFEALPDVVLDGELYSHSLKDDFNELSSLIRKSDRDPERQAEFERVIEFHVYDLPSDPVHFGERSGELRSLLEEYGPEGDDAHLVQFVRTDMVRDQVHLDSLYEEYLEAGYEGQMVRTDSPYTPDRTKNLLKRKEFTDGEFPILGVYEGKGNWAGHAKKVECSLPNGETFKAGIRGNKAFTSKLLGEWKSYEGVTVRYKGLTPGGKPRFGVAVAWHEDLDNRG